MIQVSWGAIAGVALLVVGIGPGFFLVGRLWNQVKVNTESIRSIYIKIDRIDQFVRKNGR